MKVVITALLSMSTVTLWLLGAIYNIQALFVPAILTSFALLSILALEVYKNWEE